MSLFGRLFHGSSKTGAAQPAGAPPPSSAAPPALSRPPELATSFSAMASSELPPAVSFSLQRLDSQDPSQPLYPDTARQQSSANFFPSLLSPTAASSSAPSPAVPLSAVAEFAHSPAPSPTAGALPAPTHRQSSSLTLPFSLLPPTSALSFASSPFASFLAGEKDAAFASPELDTLWLRYEEEKSNILAISALESFARALLPTLPPAGEPGPPTAGHPVRLLHRLKADVIAAWPDMRKAISDAILGKRLFAATVDFTVDAQPGGGDRSGGRGAGAASGDAVVVCAGLGPSFLGFYLLHRLFAFAHNRRLLLRMDWAQWLVKVCQLMASQYHSSHHHIDTAANADAADDEEEGEDEGGQEAAEQGVGDNADVEEKAAADHRGVDRPSPAQTQSADAVKDGPVQDDPVSVSATVTSAAVQRSGSGSSNGSRLSVLVASDSEQQLKEAEWQRRKAEMAERRRSTRRLHLYLESLLHCCLSMCALIVDAEDDWRNRSTRRLTAVHGHSSASSNASSTVTSPATSAAASSLAAVPSLTAQPTHARLGSEAYREGQGSRTTVLDDSGLVEVLTALLRVLAGFPMAALSYSQLTLIRATLQAMGAVAFDNKRVQYLLIQQTALDALCQTLRWERHFDPEPPQSGDSSAGDATGAVPMQSPSSFNRVTDRTTVDVLFGAQERDEQEALSGPLSTGASTPTSASSTPRSISAPTPVLHSKHSRSRSASLHRPSHPPMAVSLYHVQLLALQVIRELTSQQLASCWEFMETVGLPSILHSVAWIISTFHLPLSPSAALDAAASVQLLNEQLTTQAVSLVSSLNEQQREVHAEDGQFLFSVPDFRMTSLSSSPYSPRVDVHAAGLPRNPWLEQLFGGVLLSFLICPDVAVTQSSSFFAMFSSRNVLASVDPYAFIGYHVLGLVMGLFDDAQYLKDDQVGRARQLMRQTRVVHPASPAGAASPSLLLPTVQLQCLAMLREATTVKPSLIPYVRARGLYSVLYTPYFYFLSDPSPSPPPLTLPKRSTSPSSTSVTLTPSLQRVLRVCVVDLLIHCMLADASGDLDAQVQEMRYLLSSYRYALSSDEVRVEDGRHALDVSKALIDLFTVRRHHAAVVLIALMNAAGTPSPTSAPSSPAHLSLPFAGVQRPSFTLDTPIPHMWTLLLARQQALSRHAYEPMLSPTLWSAVLLLLEHVLFSSQSMAVRLLRDDSFCLQLSELLREADHAQRCGTMRMVIALMTCVGAPDDPDSALIHSVPASPALKSSHAAPAPSPSHRRASSTLLPHPSPSPPTHPMVPPPVSVPSTPVFGPGEAAHYADELQRHKRLLFARFLELLPWSMSQSLAVVEDVLCGLRKVLSVHTANHQDILRRRQALLHVTNVLVTVLSREQRRKRDDEADDSGDSRASSASPTAGIAAPPTLPPLTRQSSDTIDRAAPRLRRDRSLFSPQPSTAAEFPTTREGGGSEGSSIVPSTMPSPTQSSSPSNEAAPPPPLRVFPSPTSSSPSPSPTSPPLLPLTREMGTRLCVSVLLTLTALLSGNRRSIDLFRRFFGYELLCELLVRCECAQPSRQVTVALLHLLVDGHFQLADFDLRVDALRRKEDDSAPDSDASSIASALRLSAASSELPSTVVSPLQSAERSAVPSPSAPAVEGAPFVPPITSRVSRAFNSMPALPDRFVIVNADVLVILFSRQRFLRCSPSHQMDLLTLFHTVIGLSPFSAALATRVSLIDLLLDLFPHFPPLLQDQPEKDTMQQRAIALIQLLGQYSITVKQLKRFLSLLRSQTVQLQPEQLSTYSVHLQPSRVVSPSSSAPSSVAASASASSATSPRSSPTPPEGVGVQMRPFYTVAALEALEAMSAREGPDNFLLFDGVRGGLSLPSLPPFPSRGWSVALWLRVESFAPPLASTSHVQRFAYSAEEVAPVAFIPTAVLNRLTPLARLTGLSAYRTASSTASTPSSTSSSASPRLRMSPSSSHHPRLLQLLTSAHGGSGVDVYFTDRRLTVSVLAGRGHAQTLLIENSALKDKQWYHLAITQSAPPTFGTSDLRVFIDGHCVHASSTLRYPAASKTLKHAFIGTDGVHQAVGEDGGEGKGMKASQSLHGQLGPFYFLDDSLSEAQVKAMHSLGPGYLFTSFTGEQQQAEADAEQRMADADAIRSPTDAHSLPLPPTASTEPAFPSTQRKRSSMTSQSAQTVAVARQISSRILLAYNAKARDGRLHLNIAPRVQEEVEKAKQAEEEAAATSPTTTAAVGVASRGMHALALEGTYQCVTRHVLDVLSCLNGIACLFPCFTQLDQPVHRCDAITGEERARRWRQYEERSRAAWQQKKVEEDRAQRAEEAAREKRRAAALQAKLLAMRQHDLEADLEGRVFDPAEFGVERKTSAHSTASDRQASATHSDVSGAEQASEYDEDDADDRPQQEDVDVGTDPDEPQNNEAPRGDEQRADDRMDGEQDDVVADLTSPPPFPRALPTPASAAHRRLLSASGDVLDASWGVVETGLDVSTSDDALVVDSGSPVGAALPANGSFTSLPQRPQPGAVPVVAVHPRSTKTAATVQSAAPSPRAVVTGVPLPPSIDAVISELPALPLPSPPSLLLDYDLHLVYDLEPRLLPALLRCLLAVFNDHPLQQSYMQTYRGFYLLSYHLEHSSPRHLSLKALHVIDRILLASRSSPRLYRSTFFALLCNLRLWLYVSPAVQRSWLRSLCQVVLKAPWLIRHASGAQRILDQLRSVCWFEPEPDSVALRHELLHPVTHATIGVRPFQQNLHTLRSEILHILHIAVTAHSSAPITAAVQLLSSIDPVTLHLPAPAGDDEDDDDLSASVAAALSPGDVQSLVYCLLSLTDEEQKVDLLHLLAQWLQGEDASMVMKALADLDQPDVTVPQDISSRLRQRDEDNLPRGGMDILLSTLQSPISAARVTSLRCLQRLLRSGVKLAEKELFVAVLHILRAEEDRRQDKEEREREERRRTNADGGGVGGHDAAALLQRAKNASQGVLDEALYLALLSLMLGDNVDEESVKEMRHGLWMEDAVILHVTVLQILFSLIAMQTSVKRNRAPPRRARTASVTSDAEDADDADAENAEQWTAASSYNPALLTSDELLVTIMQDVQFLLLYSDNNKTLVLEQWSWPSWLFALMVEPARHRRQAAAARRPASASIASSASFSRPPPGDGGYRPSTSTSVPSERPLVRQPAPREVEVMSIIHDDDGAGSSASGGSATAPRSPLPDSSTSAAFQSSMSFVTTASGPLFSYALSMFDSILFYALHKPLGWKTYERCLSWLSMYTFSSTPSPLPHFPAWSTPCYHPLPVLQILRSVLFSLHVTLRKEAEVRSKDADELSALMDNVQQLTQVTESFLLHRLSAYAHMLEHPSEPAQSPAASPTAAPEPERSPSGGGRMASSASLTNLNAAVPGDKASWESLGGTASPSSILEAWVLAEMMTMIEGEMTAVWPVVELLLGTHAWLFLLRQQAADEQSAASLAAAQAAEAELQASAARSMWRKFSSSKSGASTPVKAFSQRDPLASAAVHRSTLQEKERETLLGLVVKVVQCTSLKSPALYSMLFATSRADDLNAIVQETFFDSPDSATDVSSILARYSTPERVRPTPARLARGPASAQRAAHRRAFSALTMRTATPTAASASVAASEPSSPKDGGDKETSLRSSLCALLSALTDGVPLWHRMDGQQIEAASSMAEMVPADATPIARLPMSSLLATPSASPPELSSLKYLQQQGEGEEEMTPRTRSFSSPSSLALAHPLREQQGGAGHTPIVSLASALALLTSVLCVMVERCQSATFLIPGAAPSPPLSREDPTLPTPSPQPISGTLSTTSSSRSPPSTPTSQPNRSPPGSLPSPLRPWQQHSPAKAGVTDDERAKEKTRLKLISQRFGLDAPHASSPSSAASTSSHLFTGGGLFSSPFSSLQPGRSSPGKTTATSSPTGRKSTLRVLTDSNAQLTFVSVTFTLPSDVQQLLLEATKADSASAMEDVSPAWLQALASFFLHSPTWLQCGAVLRPVAAYLLASEGGEIRKQIDAFKRSAAYLLDLHGTVQQTDAQQWTITRMYVDALRQQHALAEQSRRQSMRQQQQRKRRSEQQTWKLILRALTNERGAWSVEDAHALTFWKLDDTENKSRMRMKTKLNHAGSRHLTAAHDEAYHTSAHRTRALPKSGSSSGSAIVASAAGTDAAAPYVAEELVKMALLFSRSQAGAIAPEANAPGGGVPGMGSTEEDEFDTLSEAAEAQGKDDVGAHVESAPVYSVACSMVHPTDKFPGQLTLTGSHLLLEAREEAPETKRRHRRRASNADEADAAKAKGRDYAWPLAGITAIHYRRHALQRNSLELFFSAASSAFLVFAGEAERDAVHVKLVKAIRVARRSSPALEALIASYTRPHVFPSLPFLYSAAKNGLFGGPWGGAPSEVLRASGLTLAWQRRQLSNFDYLMQLNTIAGRTFADLAQYPVFPWVLSDYSSERLELHDEAQWPLTFRDLTKPIGALNPERLQHFVERYHSLARDADPALPPFMYGSSFSNSAFVLFYLLRVEPFTSAAIALQDGHFDHADRLFASVAQTWQGVLQGPADVKELIPEFFFLPEMFRNDNRLPLGRSQEAVRVDDVELPPWAGGSAEQFVRLHREALESEYVSLHLHHWIDLVFGYKQRGKDAEAAHNVFFHLTYEGAVDLDQIDPALRAATVAQIEHFGSCPTQLLQAPHPQRFSLQQLESTDRMLSIFPSLQHLQLYEDAAARRMTSKGSVDNPLLLVYCAHTTDRLLVMGLDRVLSVHKWKNSSPSYLPPYTLELERKSRRRRRVGVHFAVGLNLLPSFFAVSRCERYLLTAGHWDNSLRVSVVASGYLHQALFGHKDVVTCVAVSETGDFVVSGSKDATVLVWAGHAFMEKRERGEEGGGGGLASAGAMGMAAMGVVGGARRSTAHSELLLCDRPKHVLYGHDDEVTCVAVSAQYDLVASGGRDGSIILHTLRTGRYTRTVPPPASARPAAVRFLHVTIHGVLVAYFLHTSTLCTFTINGRPLQSVALSDRLFALLVSPNGAHVMAGGEAGVVSVFRVSDLVCVQQLTGSTDNMATIRCLSLTPNEQHLLAGTAKGEMLIYALDQHTLTAKLMKRLQQIGL